MPYCGSLKRMQHNAAGMAFWQILLWITSRQANSCYCAVDIAEKGVE